MTTHSLAAQKVVAAQKLKSGNKTAFQVAVGLQEKLDEAIALLQEAILSDTKSARQEKWTRIRAFLAQAEKHGGKMDLEQARAALHKTEDAK